MPVSSASMATAPYRSATARRRERTSFQGRARRLAHALGPILYQLPPKLAFVSHSMFGSSTRPSAIKMRRAHELFAAAHPEVECDGEMHGDAALSESVRQAFLPDSKLTGAANLLVLPTLDAANILFNVLKISASHGVTVGPILLGSAKPVHILTPSATVRRIVNMTALAVADVREARLAKG